VTTVDLSILPEVRVFPIPKSQRDYYGLAASQGICNGTDHYGYTTSRKYGACVHLREHEACNGSMCQVLGSSRLDPEQYLNDWALQGDLGLKMPLPAGTVLVSLTHAPGHQYPKADLGPKSFALQTSKEILPGILATVNQRSPLNYGEMEYRLMQPGESLVCWAEVGFWATQMVYHLANHNGQLVMTEICKPHKLHTRRGRRKLAAIQEAAA
jgi:hypothetical protein